MDPEPKHEPTSTRADVDVVAEPVSGTATDFGGAVSGSVGLGEPSPSNGRVVDGSPPKPARKTRPRAGLYPNNVKKLRQRAMMSKAELARRAAVSPLTIDRVESGCPCRMDTKRKILEALGLDPLSARQVFPDVDLG